MNIKTLKKWQAKNGRGGIRVVIVKAVIRVLLGEEYHLRSRPKKNAIPLTGVGSKEAWAGGKEKVLLREPETCSVCGKVYLSLYPLRTCGDHEGLEAV